MHKKPNKKKEHKTGYKLNLGQILPTQTFSSFWTPSAALSSPSSWCCHYNSELHSFQEELIISIYQWLPIISTEWCLQAFSFSFFFQYAREK